MPPLPLTLLLHPDSRQDKKSSLKLLVELIGVNIITISTTQLCVVPTQ
jgi:hypothetical protein